MSSRRISFDAAPARAVGVIRRPAEVPPLLNLRHVPRAGLVLAGGFLALASILMATVVFSARQQSDGDLLRRALEVEVTLNDVLSALQDAETGQRGYLLANDTSFLGPYRAASAQIDPLLDRLDAALRSATGQSATSGALRAAVEAKRAEMARTLALAQAGDILGAIALVKSRSGMVLMDRVRDIIGGMDREQDRLAEGQQKAIERIRIVTTAGTAVSLVLMALVALAALNEVRKGARLARFLPAEVASRLAEGDRGLDEGRSGPATVVFVDIRGSTALAETLAPTDLSRLLTAFRAAVSTAAAQQGGMVDKFVGDGALVVFGALDDDARASARSIAFARALLGGSALKAGAVAVDICIGIHQGEVFCGVVGAGDRREFTVLGDTVNVASRIERATRRFGVDLLVSEAVLTCAGEEGSRWKEVSHEPLRGRRENVALYAEVKPPR